MDRLRAMQKRSDGQRSSSAFTLIELLVVIMVIVVLMGLLLPTLALVRKRGAIASAKQTVKQVAMSLDSYRSADAEHRYPPPQSDSALSLRPPTVGSSAILSLLDRHGLPVPRPDQLDDQGRLLDPWGQPFRFVLARPVVSDPASLHDWNYDTAKSRERAWGRRWDDGAGGIAEGALPYPYVYSLGVDGRSDVGAAWIHQEDGQ